MRYLIRYENKTNATASAQVVTVTNLLSNTLDWNTFELGDMGFGANIISVPKGRSHYSTRIDVVKSLGVFVDVNADINLTNGMVLWTFRSIDPVTGGEPEDPFAGFLPPNTNAPAGEGWIRYSVKTRTNITDGTIIPALASIVFDVNEKIDTPTYRNTIDNWTPSSFVENLPNTSPESFAVTWKGMDAAGAGIMNYDIYVSSNNLPYSLWMEAATNTSATFYGSVGQTYSFYSIARDNVGHMESAPLVPDAITTVTSTTVVPPPSLTIKMTNRNLVFNVQGTVGKTYSIQYTPVLSRTNIWTTLTNITLTAPVQNWTDPDTLKRKTSFYRALQLP